MNTIYIAGSYRAPTKQGIIQNIQKASDASKTLSKMGWCVFTPHLNWGLFDGICPDDFWLECGLEILKRSDAIYMLKDWKKSLGAITEHQLARKLKLPIFYEGRGLPMLDKGIKGISD